MSAYTTESLERRRACRVVDPKLSTDGLPRVPFVKYNPGVPDLPCDDFWKPNAKDPDQRSVIVGLGARSVPAEECARQRAGGLCLRENLNLICPVDLEV